MVTRKDNCDLNIGVAVGTACGGHEFESQTGHGVYLKLGTGIHDGLGEQWVKENLNNPDMFKSTGPNGRHPRVLNELAEVITEPLDIIFENSWRTDEVPEDWKRAYLEPSFKKGTWMMTLEILISLTFCLEKFWNNRFVYWVTNLQQIEMRQ